MKKLLIILMLAVMVLPFVFADVAISTVTKVYFEKDGQPYNGEVDFTVNCYGYTYSPGAYIEKEPGTYTSEKVFSFSATCLSYGCKIYESYYMNYRHIDYCDLEGNYEGQSFEIENYSDNPINFDECGGNGYDMFTKGKYYKTNDAYRSCQDNLLKEYMKCHEDFKKNNETSLEDRQREYQSCIAEKDADFGGCEKYAEEINESVMEMNSNGYPFDRVCKLKFDISKKIMVNEIVKNESDEKNKFCESIEDNKCYKNLSNGRKAEIKIMPWTASERAIERLGQLNFTVQLKEVGKGDEAKAIYELSGEKQGRFLGLFKIKGEVKAEIDAETGEFIKVKKPWWAFLTSGI